MKARNSYADLKLIKAWLANYMANEQTSYLMAKARKDPLAGQYLMRDDELIDLLKKSGLPYQASKYAFWHLRSQLGFKGKTKRMHLYDKLYEMQSLTTTEPVYYQGRKIE